MELYYTRTKRVSLVRWSISTINGFFKRFSSSSTKMYVQASPSTSKYLSIWYSMPLDIEWWIRLEAKHHSETNSFGYSKTFERWTKHWQSSSARAFEHVQKWSKKISWKCQKLCCQMQTSCKMRKGLRKMIFVKMLLDLRNFCWSELILINAFFIKINFINKKIKKKSIRLYCNPNKK